MLLAPQDRSSSRKRTGLNRWKQITRKPSPTKVIHYYRELVERGGEAGTSPEDSCSAACASFLFPQGHPYLAGPSQDRPRGCIALMKGA